MMGGVILYHTLAHNSAPRRSLLTAN